MRRNKTMTLSEAAHQWGFQPTGEVGATPDWGEFSVLTRGQVRLKLFPSVGRFILTLGTHWRPGRSVPSFFHLMARVENGEWSRGGGQT
jgi:hypothetical protein